MLTVTTMTMCVVLAIASPAIAGQERRIWVAAGGSANVDSSWSVLPAVVSPDLSVSASLPVAPHLDARILFDLPARVTTTEVLTEPLNTGLQRLTITETKSSPGLTAALAYGHVGRSWSQSATVGIAFMRHVDDTHLLIEPLAPNTGAPTDRTTHYNFNWPGPTFGYDVEYRLTNRLGVAIDARVVWFPLTENTPSPFIVRSGIALRYRVD